MGRYENLEYAVYNGVGEYGFAKVEPTLTTPNIDKWVQINYAKSTLAHKEKTGVNFYTIDQQFERVWNFPNRYCEILKDFGAVIGTDFSTYANFPKAMRVYNTYRNRWLDRYMQDNGITLIPCVRWGLKDDWDWCFDGLPEGSIVSVSNVGCMNSAENRKIFNDGYNEMLKRLQPSKVIFYAHKFDDYVGPVQFIRFSMNKSEYAN